MNKAELKAITMIANKLNWHNKPVMEVCETIKQMVRNQQALELDTVGECDDDEETLLSIALWDAEKITSTMYVSDYFSLANWNCYCNCGWECTFEDFCAMMYWDTIKAELLAAEYEEEDCAYADIDTDYYAEIMNDVIWMNHHC